MQKSPTWLFSFPNENAEDMPKFIVCDTLLNIHASKKRFNSLCIRIQLYNFSSEQSVCKTHPLRIWQKQIETSIINIILIDTCQIFVHV